MSCSCGHNPCQCYPAAACDANNERNASVMQNFITELFGTITKTCVNGEVQWVPPCNLNTGLPSNPRIAGESILCYFMRLLETTLGSGFTGTQDVVINVDYTTPDLTQTMVTNTYVNGVLTSVSAPFTTLIVQTQSCQP